MSVNFTVLIPARLASSRLPNKPLADLAGKPMVVRVAERVALAGAERIVVATDSSAVMEVCQQHGVAAVMTRADHASGSDRLAEACELLNLDGDNIVVNVQGDEPLIDPSLVSACARMLQSHPECSMATAGHRIDSVADLRNPNVVKVVVDLQDRALYFSRASIPWWRDGAQDGMPALPPADVCPALRHIGLYAYRAAYLRRFPTLSAAPQEQVEALEQLRVLWHGDRIAVFQTDAAPAPGVDTPEDLERVRQLMTAHLAG